MLMIFRMERGGEIENEKFVAGLSHPLILVVMREREMMCDPTLR